jgi:hypothetical protein
VGFVWVFASAGLLAAIAGIAHARGTDVKIESNNLDLVLNQKPGPTDRFGIPINNSTTLGFNEDSDPALSRNF